MTDNRPPNLGDGSEDITGIPQCSAEADVEFTRDYEVIIVYLSDYQTTIKGGLVYV